MKQELIKSTIFRHKEAKILTKIFLAKRVDIRVEIDNIFSTWQGHY